MSYDAEQGRLFPHEIFGKDAGIDGIGAIGYLGAKLLHAVGAHIRRILGRAARLREQEGITRDADGIPAGSAAVLP